MFDGLLKWLRGEQMPVQREPEDSGVTEPLFVYIKIPARLSPLERGERYEDPLEAALFNSGLGEVTGGGTMLGLPGPDGPTIEFCGIDVELYEVEEGLELLRNELVRLRAPRGTMLEFAIEGEDHAIDIYAR